MVIYLRSNVGGMTTTPAVAQASQRTYALKRMRKSSVVQCPEHVFCEQSITSNTAHPFCIRQYGSFQVPARHQSFPHTLAVYDVWAGPLIPTCSKMLLQLRRSVLPRGTCTTCASALT